MSDFDIKQFLNDRKEALLSMDRAAIEAYMKKYDVPVPSESLFWATVHKARTADNLLPMWERAASKKWLTDRGMSGVDDGDVLPPKKNTELKRYFARLAEWDAGGR